MLTRLLVNRLLVNIAYMKKWVHLTFVLVHLRIKLGAPVQPVGSLATAVDSFVSFTLHEPIMCSYNCVIKKGFSEG